MLEFLVGIDALTVAVSKDSFVDELTRSQLIAIFTGEVTQWNEVNAEWPAATIQLFTPGTDSGTFDFFGEAVLGTKGLTSEATLPRCPQHDQREQLYPLGAFRRENAIFTSASPTSSGKGHAQTVALANDDLRR